MGFSYNQVGKWESDTTKMTWTDFYDFCNTLGVSLDKPMRDIFLSMKVDIKNPQNTFRILRNFTHDMSIEDLALRLNCHSSVVRRWISGKVCPDIEIIFAMMDFNQNLLLMFVSKIIDIQKIPSLKNQYQEIDRTRLMGSAYPASTLVQLCLGLKAYLDLPVHSDKFIQEKTGLDLGEVKRSLSLLMSFDIIQFKDEKYQSQTAVISNINGDTNAVQNLRRFVNFMNIKRFDTLTGIPPNKKDRLNFQGSYFASVSRVGADKITDRLHQCFEEIRQIVKEDTLPEEEIRVILIESFSPDDVPKFPNPSFSELNEEHDLLL